MIIDVQSFTLIVWNIHFCKCKLAFSWQHL